MDDEEKELVGEIEEPSTEIDEEITKEVEETVEETPADEELLKKKKKKKIIIIVSIIIALLLIAGITIFLLTRNKKDNKPEEKQTDQITITFDSNGGNKIEPLKIDKNGRINYPIPEREDHLFQGWYNVDEKVSRTTTFDKDVTLTAHWEELTSSTKTMVITYDTKGVTTVDSETIICGLPIELPEFHINGYYLKGWLDDEGLSVSRGVILPCKDITLHADIEEYEPYVELNCPQGYYPRNYKGQYKCAHTVSTIADCKNGTTVDYGTCYDLNDTVEGTISCGTGYFLYTPEGNRISSGEQGEYFNGYCGFGATYWKEYTEETCQAKYEEQPMWANNKCYAYVAKYDYAPNCPEGYNYRKEIEKCVKYHDEYLTCPEGYEKAEDSYHTCIKLTDPI